MIHDLTAKLAGLLVVVALFGAPLFIGLDGWDLRSDEAIYSYAVDRTLDTGDWLTPRSIQVDGPFLEKPPLKIWMVAGAMRAGVLPRDEFGYRFLDALMGAIAFIYIYLIGMRIAGPICGVVAALVTFSMDSIVFEHGLRSNNMEAPLFLMYCAGVYHFMQWIDGGRRPRLHAFAVCLYFVLGFMTKFVAALFLPIVCAVTIAIVPMARQRLRMRWHDWIAPIVLTIVAIAPWFVYESRLFGRDFWRVILGEHVYARFTGALDTTHLQPWHFYFTRTWTELSFSGGRFVAVIAVVGLFVKAWHGRPWQMRLVLTWWLVPFALMSIGTSKLFHYAYPFLPPIGLAVGWLAAAVMAGTDSAWGVALAGRLERLRPRVADGARAPASLFRGALVVIAVTAIALGIMTAVHGQVIWSVGSVKLLQNSSVVRPLLIAALLLTLAGRTSLSVKTLAALVLAIVLPVSTYQIKAGRVTSVDRRRQALRDCAAQVSALDGTAARGVYNAARTAVNWSDYYYLSGLGPWDEPDRLREEDVRRRLFAPGQQTLVRMTPESYERWRTKTGHAADTNTSFPPAIIVDDAAFVTPGPYAPCAAAAPAAAPSS